MFISISTRAKFIYENKTLNKDESIFLRCLYIYCSSLSEMLKYSQINKFLPQFSSIFPFVFWSCFTCLTRFVDIAFFEQKAFVMGLGRIWDIEKSVPIAVIKHFALIFTRRKYLQHQKKIHQPHCPMKFHKYNFHHR